MVLAGTIGWYASFRLTVDDWRLLRNPAQQPSRAISPVVSCGSVMSSPQGSLFGFPGVLLGALRGAPAAVARAGRRGGGGSRVRALAGGAVAPRAEHDLRTARPSGPSPSRSSGTCTRTAWNREPSGLPGAC
ncbi:vitamin K epoxide reductase family protein [Streptomyces sp. enrichment culture]|uniref:vitamin K epoxide reductase family protein n=1 Tax=Streptomyces sp. enrichment culture TaxID=1795815 RepID=UPI003F5509C0